MDITRRSREHPLHVTLELPIQPWTMHTSPTSLQTRRLWW